jgi:hypothetical protein
VRLKKPITFRTSLWTLRWVSRVCVQGVLCFVCFL